MNTVCYTVIPENRIEKIFMEIRIHQIWLVFLLIFSEFSLLALTGLNAQYDPRQGGWAHEYSSLQPDPAVEWGTLDNGLRYAFLPHQGVPGRVSMHLIILAGSLDEKERERGLAHFLEHMAFNGTRNFDEDEIMGYFQRLGMEFGSDVNAYTTADRTVYGLEFASSEPRLIREGFSLYRDFAENILLDPEEIDKERGVILSELRIHDGVGFRVSEASGKFFFKGMRFPERSPIGLVDVIRNATRRDLKGFYDRLYRPDLMVLVAVGDLDVAQFRGWTEEFLGPLERPDEPIPPREMGELAPMRYPRVKVLSVMHAGSVKVQGASVQTEAVPPDSLEHRRRETHRRLATSLMGSRLQKAGAGSAQVEYMRMGELKAGMATVGSSRGEWEKGLLAIDNMVRQILKQGFDMSEIERPLQRALLEKNVQRAQASTMDPASLANRLVESIAEGEVYLGARRELAMEIDLLEDLNPEPLNRAFREVWSPDHMAYFLSGEVSIEGGSREVLKVLSKSRNEPPATPVLSGGGGPSLAQLLQPSGTIRIRNNGRRGKVVKEEVLSDFDAHLMRFDNHVRFNFMESEEEPGLVRTQIRVGAGLLEDSSIRKGLREFGLETVLGSGTDRYPVGKIRSYLESNVLEFSFDITDHDAFTFRGIMQSRELEEFYAIVSDFLRAPRFSHHVQQSVKFNTAMARMSRSFGISDGMRAFQDYLFNDDGRFAWGNPLDYRSLGVSHVRDWIGDALINGYVEVSLIGDISREEAVEAAARTFGTLPVREEEKRIANPRPVRVQAPPGFQRLEFVGEEHQAVALGIWPSYTELTLEERMGMLLVSRVLEQRMRVLFRERLGMAYAPNAEFISHPEYPNFSMIQAQVDCSPEDADAIARALQEVADELAQEGMTRNEFLGALNPVQSHLKQSLRSNGMILDRLLKKAQETPRTIEEMRAIRDGAFQNLEVDRVNALAASVLKKGRARTAAVVPKPFVGVFKIDTESGGQPVIGR